MLIKINLLINVKIHTHQIAYTQKQPIRRPRDWSRPESITAAQLSISVRFFSVEWTCGAFIRSHNHKFIHINNSPK